MCKDITIESPEFRVLYDELSELAETKRQREVLNDTSFREWVCKSIQILASKLGYHIQNICEFTLDMGYCFRAGFTSGRELAKAKSIRNKEKEEQA